MWRPDWTDGRLVVHRDRWFTRAIYTIFAKITKTVYNTVNYLEDNNMAKLIKDDTRVENVYTAYSWWKVALLGVGGGVAYFVLTLLLGQFIIDPLFCRSVDNSAACLNSTDVSGNIANILVATALLVAFIRMRVVRPIVIAIAAVIALWGLASWTNGLVWAEALLWTVAIFGLIYTLFSWICRYSRTVPVLAIVILVVVALRVVPIL